MLVEHEYECHRTLAYLAALDIRRRGKASRGPKLFGRCEEKVGIEPFGRLVEQVMTQEPYASAPRVFWDRRQRLLPRRQGVDRAARGHLGEPAAHPPPLPRLMAQPDRDLLLDPPTQGAHPQGLRLACRARRADHGLPSPLAAGRRAVRLELHPPRPRSADGAPRHPRPPATTRGLSVTRRPLGLGRTEARPPRATSRRPRRMRGRG
jgi:hypothetical protein